MIVPFAKHIGVQVATMHAYEVFDVILHELVLEVQLIVLVHVEMHVIEVRVLEVHVVILEVLELEVLFINFSSRSTA